MAMTFVRRLGTLLLIGTLGCASLKPVLHNSAELARLPRPAVPNSPSHKMGVAPAIALGALGAVIALIVIINWNGQDQAPLVPVL